MSHGRAVTKVDLMDCHIFGDIGDVLALDLRIVKIIKVVKNGDLMTAAEQFFDKVRADEPSAAGDENSHSTRSSTTKDTKCTKKIRRVCGSLFYQASCSS